jgi:hypothetical protein
MRGHLYVLQKLGAMVLSFWAPEENYSGLQKGADSHQFMGSMSKEQSFKLLDAFYEAGGNFIDTAVRPSRSLSNSRFDGQNED